MRDLHMTRIDDEKSISGTRKCCMHFGRRKQHLTAVIR
jgi:hypothetical protein